MVEGTKIHNESTQACMAKIRSIIPGNSSELGIMECYIDQYETTVVLIRGGLNGSGYWSDYFHDLARLGEALEAQFEDAWLIEIENDCADDVFYAYFGVREYGEDEDSLAETEPGTLVGEFEM